MAIAQWPEVCVRQPDDALRPRRLRIHDALAIADLHGSPGFWLLPASSMTTTLPAAGPLPAAAAHQGAPLCQLYPLSRRAMPGSTKGMHHEGEAWATLRALPGRLSLSICVGISAARGYARRAAEHPAQTPLPADESHRIRRPRRRPQPAEPPSHTADISPPARKSEDASHPPRRPASHSSRRVTSHKQSFSFS